MEVWKMMILSNIGDFLFHDNFQGVFFALVDLNLAFIMNVLTLPKQYSEGPQEIKSSHQNL